jgi:hypothetical protein
MNGRIICGTVILFLYLVATNNAIQANIRLSSFIEIVILYGKIEFMSSVKT